MPPAMFAPAALCTREICSRARIAAVKAAVVVLPLVAEMSTLPRVRRAASCAMASRSSRMSTLPGALVAPPPRRRESAADGPREGELGGQRTGHQAPSGRLSRRRGRHEHADGARQRAYARGELRDGVAVGIQRERPVGGDAHLAWRAGRARWAAHVGALEHLGEVGEETQLGDLLDRDDVEQAVVHARVGGEAHPAAVDAGVGGGDGVAAEAVGRPPSRARSRSSPACQPASTRSAL